MLSLKLRLPLVVLALLLPAGVSAQQKASGKPGKPVNVARVTRLEGTLESASAEAGPWTPLKLKSTVSEGSILRTGPKTRAELALPGDSVIRIGPESRLKLTKILFPPEKKDARVEARLITGRLWARVSSLFGGPDPRFQVSAGNAVAGVRGTAFEINFAELTGDNTAPEPAGSLKVYEGTVAVGRYNPFEAEEKHKGGGIVAPTDVKGPGDVPPPFRDVSREEWTRLLVAGMQVPFGAGEPGKAEPEKIDNEEDLKDDFTRWNRELDGLMAPPSSPE